MNINDISYIQKIPKNKIEFKEAADSLIHLDG